jgi:hypothetical protein
LRQPRLGDIARQFAILFGAIFQAYTSYSVGPAVGEIARETRSLILPASYAFAIWGPIFLLCGVYAVYQALPAQRENTVFRAAGWWAAGAFLANGAWVSVYTNRQFVLAQIVIIVALICAAVAYLRFTRAVPASRATAVDNTLVGPAFGLLAGWLTAASVVGMAGTLVALGIDATGRAAEVWGAALLVTGAIVAIGIIQASKRGPTGALIAYAAAVLWALAAVIVEQRAASTVTTATALVCAVLVLLMLGAALRTESAPAGRSFPG